MRDTDSLTVEISGDCITVSKSRGTQRVTFIKDPSAPLLVSHDVLRENVDASRAAFLAQAWKEAYATAHRLGWLRSG